MATRADSGVIFTSGNTRCFHSRKSVMNKSRLYHGCKIASLIRIYRTKPSARYGVTERLAIYTEGN